MRSSIPLQVQPQAFGGLGIVAWGQCLYYGSKYSLKKTLLCVGAFYVFFAAFETGSVYALWAGERRGVTWPLQLYGWLTSALLIIGLLPQYWEIYKHKEVVGISLLFMAVDIGGGLFSGISLFFRAHFDSTAFVQYMLVVVMDGLVVILACILNPMAKKRRAREAALRDAENSVGGVEGEGVGGGADGDASDATVGDEADNVDEKDEKHMPRSDSYARTVTVTAVEDKLDDSAEVAGERKP